MTKTTKQPGRAKNKTSKVSIAAKMKAAQALELRKEGTTFAEIAKELKYNSPQAAYDAVRRALDATLREPADEVRKLELERLDALWQIQYLNAQSGDLQALTACLSLMDRRAKLVGIYMPTKVEMGGPDGQPLPSTPVLPTVIQLVAPEIEPRQD